MNTSLHENIKVLLNTVQSKGLIAYEVNDDKIYI